MPAMTPKKAMDTIENLNDVVNDEIQRKAAKKALTLAKTANQKERVPKATSKPSLSTVGASPERPLLGRRGSFSDVETFFLHGLLVDNNNVPGKDQNEKITANESQKKEVKFLTDDILFSVVSEEQITRATKTTDQYPKLPSSHQKAQRAMASPSRWNLSQQIKRTRDIISSGIIQQQRCGASAAGIRHDV